MTRKANYRIVSAEENRVVIRDIGPWDKFMTVTNAADGVVAELFAEGYLANANTGVPKRLFYYDSEGQFDELLHEGGVFRGFKPAVRP